MKSSELLELAAKLKEQEEQDAANAGRQGDRSKKLVEIRNLAIGSVLMLGMCWYLLGMPGAPKNQPVQAIQYYEYGE